jgi:aminopeptidase N
MEASPSPKKGKDSCRLEVSIVPIHYDLTYHYIDLERFVFRGTCQLHGRSVVDTTTTTNTKIQLHALELQIYSVKLVSKHENSTQTTTPQDEAVEVRYHRIHQTVDLIFVDKPIVPDEEYVLLMDFQGSLNDQMVGLYRSVYPDIHGVSRIMATTQFEATSARRAFPCMDEPALKATFQLTVTIPARLQCISNTPVADRHTNATTPIVTGSGSSTPQQTIQFHRTPKMSTYLVALVVGELDGIAKTNGFVTTTVYTVPGKATQAAFCLETATQCLDLYQQLFQVPYPLTKSDLVAIPDFAAGAMEVRKKQCFGGKAMKRRPAPLTNKSFTHQNHFVCRIGVVLRIERPRFWSSREAPRNPPAVV